MNSATVQKTSERKANTQALFYVGTDMAACIRFNCFVCRIIYSPNEFGEEDLSLLCD